MKELKKFFSKHKYGFTLVELLVAVVILGVLATIVVPTYNKLIRKSRVADGLSVLELLANAQEKYYVQHETYAGRLATLNAPLKNQWVDNIENTDKLDTRNFTYSKGSTHDQVTANCVFAQSRDPKMQYTLVKNYKTHAKVGCMGPACDKLTDYVSPAAEGICPPGQENHCDLTPEDCPSGTIFNAETCSCDSEPNPIPPDPIPPVPPPCSEGAVLYDCPDPTFCRTCTGGEWTACSKCISPIPPIPPDPESCDPSIPQTQATECTVYKRECIEDNGAYIWKDTSETEWKEPDYECESGEITDCEDPTDECDYSGWIPGKSGGVLPPPNPVSHGTKKCIKCKWDCCTHCDMAEKPDDYTSSCAFYRSQCLGDEEYGWISGYDYYIQHNYNGVLNYKFSEWLKEGYECENGDRRGCDTGGTQTCHDCHWGECEEPNHNYQIISGELIVRPNLSHRYCPNGVLSETVDICGPINSDTYCEERYFDSYQCDGSGQTLNICNLNNNNYGQYCEGHSGEKCIVGGYDACSNTTGLEKCCPGYEGCTNGNIPCEVNNDCIR